ncbi:MAG: hypothetical protein U0L79_07030 [Lachnospiraceae bacterium]|nr:hypothetical protein [Lachnospiraceae bacterium]
MNDYKEYYIAFIDVLGFKQMVQEKTCKEIVDIYDSIKAMRTLQKKVEKNGERISVPLIPSEEIHIKVMSDLWYL